jgi:uncharacterized protein
MKNSNSILHLAMILVSIEFASLASAGPVEEGNAAYKAENYEAAFTAFSAGAEQGLAQAQFSIGVMYMEGKGVPQDDQQALDWYRKAAEQGLPKAQYNMGYIYNNGKGVPQDFKQAAGWYRKAADQGAPKAQNSLGIMYQSGKGVSQDYIQAYKWFSLAAANGIKKATESRDVVGAKMTTAQITEARKLEREWKPSVADDIDKR